MGTWRYNWSRCKQVSTLHILPVTSKSYCICCHNKFTLISSRWKVHKIPVGRIKQVFRIILEVVPGGNEAYIAIDNIKLIDCFPDSTRPACTPHQFRCKDSDICINTTKICDITLDCQSGDDEIQNCGT